MHVAASAMPDLVSPRLYVEVARTAFRRQFAYRSAAVAGLITNSVFGVLLCSIFIALFEARGGAEIGGFDRQDTVTFVWLNQSLIAPIAIWGWWEIALTIRTGDVVSDLMKPYDYLTYWLARDLGRGAAAVLMRGIPTLLIGALLYDLRPPDGVEGLVSFAVGAALAIVLSFALRFCFNLVTFWVLDMQGIRSMQMAIFNFFSGMLLPISFYPPALEVVLNVLPFRGIVMTPIELWLGQGSPVVLVGAQLGWIAAVLALGAWMLRQAVRKVVVQGG